MTTPDSVRSSVVSEIEESIIAGNPGFVQDGGYKNIDSTDRDYAIPVYAMRKAIVSGLDSRYIPSMVRIIPHIFHHFDLTKTYEYLLIIYI
jgi:hypothetical protein